MMVARYLFDKQLNCWKSGYDKQCLTERYVLPHAKVISLITGGIK
jgi:hypothetical protein